MVVPKLLCRGSRSRSAVSIVVFDPCGTTTPSGAVLPQPHLVLTPYSTSAPWCGTTAWRPKVKNYFRSKRGTTVPPRHGTTAAGADVIFYIRNPARYYRRFIQRHFVLSKSHALCFFQFGFDPFCSRASLCVFVSRWWLRFCSSLESQP